MWYYITALAFGIQPVVAMLLTRQECYGLIAAKHLAGYAHMGIRFSAKDLAELYGFPEETVAKTLQRLAKARLLDSRHGMNGGYRLARDPRNVTVLEIIKASEESSRTPTRSKTPPSTSDPARIVSRAVATALERLTIDGM